MTAIISVEWQTIKYALNWRVIMSEKPMWRMKADECRKIGSALHSMFTADIIDELEDLKSFIKLYEMYSNREKLAIDWTEYTTYCDSRENYDKYEQAKTEAHYEKDIAIIDFAIKEYLLAIEEFSPDMFENVGKILQIMKTKIDKWECYIPDDVLSKYNMVNPARKVTISSDNDNDWVNS